MRSRASVFWTRSRLFFGGIEMVMNCDGRGCEIAIMCARFRMDAAGTLCSFASNANGPAVHWVPVRMVRAA